MLDEGALAVDGFPRRPELPPVGLRTGPDDRGRCRGWAPGPGPVYEIDEAAPPMGAPPGPGESNSARRPFAGVDLRMMRLGRAVAVDAHRVAQGAELVDEVVGKRVQRSCRAGRSQSWLASLCCSYFGH